MKTLPLLLSKSVGLALMFAVCATLPALKVQADSVEEINAKSLNALVFLRDQVDGSDEFLRNAAGVLVFPDVVKLGFGVGGEYGEGVLLVDEKPDSYYAMSGLSYGLPLGVKFKAEVIVFVDPGALEQFRASRGWDAGVEGRVVLAKRGSGAGIDPRVLESGVVGFIFSDNGLLSDLDFEGAKVTRLAR